MKYYFFLFTVLVAVYATSIEEQWKEFKIKNGKVYRSREEKLRFNIFKSNLQIIEEHNTKYRNGETSYQMAVNKFADLTNDEFVQKYFNHKLPNLGKTTVFKKPLDFETPDEIDWRDKNAVLPVKNQGDCVAGWAFSVTGALEGQNAILHGKQVKLSEQQLIDCSNDYGNRGCAGGYVTGAFEYVVDNGIDTDDSYTFTGENGTCGSGTDSGIKITGYVSVTGGEYSLKDAIGSVGPISVTIASNRIQLYSGGIYDEIMCLPTYVDHGALAVGYGNDNGTDFWLVKNSWGTDWGEEGYIRMIRYQFNTCGIAKMPFYPTIE